MSLTRPTKQAIPPTVALPAPSAASSAPASKSASWIKIFMPFSRWKGALRLTARHRGKDRHFIAILKRCDQARQLLIAREPVAAVHPGFLGPYPAALAQHIQQRGNVGFLARKFDHFRFH